jgi:hypothetical protein
MVENSNFLTETGTFRYPVLSALFCLKLSNLMKFLTTGSFYPYFVVRHLSKSCEAVARDKDKGGSSSLKEIRTDLNSIFIIEERVGKCYSSKT